MNITPQNRHLLISAGLNLCGLQVPVERAIDRQHKCETIRIRCKRESARAQKCCVQSKLVPRLHVTRRI